MAQTTFEAIVHAASKHCAVLIGETLPSPQAAGNFIPFMETVSSSGAVDCFEPMVDSYNLAAKAWSWACSFLATTQSTLTRCAEFGENFGARSSDELMEALGRVRDLTIGDADDSGLVETYLGEVTLTNAQTHIGHIISNDSVVKLRDECNTRVAQLLHEWKATISNDSPEEQTQILETFIKWSVSLKDPRFSQQVNAINLLMKASGRDTALKTKWAECESREAKKISMD